MFDKLLEWLHGLNMIPCECGCRDDHWNVKDEISGCVCEAEIVCDKCGKVVNYWAYGNTEFPETYSQLVWEKVLKVLNFLNLKQRYRNRQFNKAVKRQHWKNNA